jgi:hypothetical protein
VRLKRSSRRRRQAAGHELFEAFDDNRVHTLLPLRIVGQLTILFYPLRISFFVRFRARTAEFDGAAQPATGARSSRCAAFTNFCRARNSFTLMVFSFMPVMLASSSTE